MYSTGRLANLIIILQSLDINTFGKTALFFKLLVLDFLQKQHFTH